MKQLYRILFGFILCIGTLSAQGQVKGYEQLIEESYDYLEQDSLEAAARSLTEAMRIEPANPGNFALLTNLGTIQRQLGQLEEALVSYTAALSRQPDNRLILLNRSSLYEEMGEMELALIDYNTVLSKFPDDPDALYSRGLIHIRNLNYLDAEADFDKMLQNNEKSKKARLGHAILEKMRGNYDMSEQIFDYLINEDKNNLLLYEERAEMYFMKGRFTRAMNDLNKIFTEGTPSAETYVLRGRIKLGQFENASAAIDFKKALELGYDSEAIAELLKEANEQ